MYRCGLLVGALAALVLASPPVSESDPSTPANDPVPTSKLSTTCYFGEPSESCTYMCEQQSMVAYCDDEKKQCACKPSDKQEVVERKDSESEESEEEKSSNSVNPETTVSPVKTNYKLSETCTLGFPSVFCVLHCKKKALKAHCEDDQNVCVCREHTPKEGLNIDWVGLFKTVQSALSESGDSGQNSQDLFNGLDWSKLFQHLQTDGEDNFDSTEFQDYEQEDTKTNQVAEKENKTQHLTFYVFDLNSLLDDEGADVNITMNGTMNGTFPPSTARDLRAMGKVIEGWATSHVVAIIVVIFLLGLILLEVSVCFKKNTPTQMEAIFPTKK